MKHADAAQGFIHNYYLGNSEVLRDTNFQTYKSMITLTRKGHAPDEAKKQEVKATLQLEGTDRCLEVRGSAPTR